MPMPDTTTVELRTETIELLADLLESDLGVADFPIEQRTAVAVRLRESLSSDDEFQEQQRGTDGFV